MRVMEGDRGAVTVEAALALCSLMAVMALVIAVVSGAGAQLRCLDAARESARLVARGEPDRARAVAAALAPRGAVVDVRLTGDQVEVRVSAAAIPGLPGLSLTGAAIAVLEPAALLTSGPPPSQLSPSDPPPPSQIPPSDPPPPLDPARGSGALRDPVAPP